MDNSKLERIISLFWKSKNNNTQYYLGKCADFAHALQKYLHGGDLYTVGQIGPNWAAHVVVKYGPYYWDIRGKYVSTQAVLNATPAAAFSGESGIKKAGPSEIAHINSLLHHDFVQDTISGLKKAEKSVK